MTGARLYFFSIFLLLGALYQLELHIFFLFLLAASLIFQDSILLCSPEWPGTHYTAQDALKLTATFLPQSHTF